MGKGRGQADRWAGLSVTSRNPIGAKCGHDQILFLKYWFQIRARFCSPGRWRRVALPVGPPPTRQSSPGCQGDGSTQAVMVSIPGHSAASLEGGQAGGRVAPTHHDEFTQAATTNFRSRSDEKVGPPRRIFLGRLNEIS